MSHASRSPMAARNSPFSAGHRVRRVVWAWVYLLLFRTSPRVLHRWRNWLLRLFGATLHPTARVYPSARVWAPWNLRMDQCACLGDDVHAYCGAAVHIGAYSTVSQYSFLCAASHDFEDVHHPLTTAPITIGRRCWLAVDVFVGPGVTIGDGTVVGARSSVFKDLPQWVVATGTPATPVRARGLGPADFGEDDSISADSALQDESKSAPTEPSVTTPPPDVSPPSMPPTPTPRGERA